MEDWEDLVEGDEDIGIPAEKNPDDEELDLTAIEVASGPRAQLRQWYEENAARQAAWVMEQQKNNCTITRKLPNKSWKSINKFKGILCSISINKHTSLLHFMLFVHDMIHKFFPHSSTNF